MIFNSVTRHDIKQIAWALTNIRETMKTTDEDHADKVYLKWVLNSNLDSIIFYANEIRKDINK